jgi:TM2 domain-containing membrane protein YozV
MDSYQNPFMAFPGISPEEMGFLQQGVSQLNETQQRHFYMIYSGKRKSPQDMLIFCIIGFWIPGLQRFVIGQIGMGILYLFTGGLCLIGSIVDIVNHKTLALEYNRKMAFESFQLVQMSTWGKTKV